MVLLRKKWPLRTELIACCAWKPFRLLERAEHHARFVCAVDGRGLQHPRVFGGGESSCLVIQAQHERETRKVHIVLGGLGNAINPSAKIAVVGQESEGLRFSDVLSKIPVLIFESCANDTLRATENRSEVFEPNLKAERVNG